MVNPSLLKATIKVWSLSYSSIFLVNSRAFFSFIPFTLDRSGLPLLIMLIVSPVNVSTIFLAVLTPIPLNKSLLKYDTIPSKVDGVTLS